MRSRLVTLTLLPPLLLLLGTLGYHFVEGWPLFDALYMTVITLTTIGFAEVHPLGTGGRVFTMFLSLGGIFTLFFAGTEVVRTWASGEIRALLGRQRLEKAMSELTDHVIVCGYGRMGRLICGDLTKGGARYVILDTTAERLADFSLRGGVPLNADATLDESLRRAGIEHARALVTVLPSDADNLFITMSARLLNERITIVARAEEEATSSKLLRAGASRVVSPYLIGGARVVQALLQPAVLDFIELATRSEHLELQLEEVLVSPNSRLAGQTVATSRLRADLNVIIVAIKQPGAPMAFNPADDARTEAGETLVMLGSRDQLQRVERMARG